MSTHPFHEIVLIHTSYLQLQISIFFSVKILKLDELIVTDYEGERFFGMILPDKYSLTC